MRRDYPMMLSVFSKLLTKESDRRVIDNLCGALCRMIVSNIDAVPLEQVRFFFFFQTRRLRAVPLASLGRVRSD